MSIQKENIRNFVIISHIDHGKSTLADRLLELTKTIEERKMKEQFLDMMDLEREKGITIKLQPVRMDYNKYIINLIDTPGHVDFTYEVSRSLVAVEGAVLLVDASQGIQAQTLANLNLAQEQNLVVIPVINKIDLPHARTEETTKEMCDLLGINPLQIIQISAKKNKGVDKVLEKVIKDVPCPGGESSASLRALVFDSVYDTYKGVVAYVRVVDGQIKKGDKIFLMASGATAEALEVGVFKPQLVKEDFLSSGEIGYIATGLKEVSQCRVGDTISLLSKQENLTALPGYKEPRPLVFASFYPTDSSQYDLLKDSLAKLKLNDSSLQYEPESSEGLGRGFRCGFLGMLHLEIVSERLSREYDLSLVASSPSVSYQLFLKGEKEKMAISSPADLPALDQIEKIEEPMVDLEIIMPKNYLGQIMKLLEGLRGNYSDTQYLTAERVLIKYQAPLAEIIVNFYDHLKNVSSGYASMSYQITGYKEADLVRLDVLVADEKVGAFSRLVHRDKAYYEGKALVGRLKGIIPQHQFAIPLQAIVGGRIIARETIKALRKDVTSGLYGGDVTRKRKLLEKQKKGKKRLKQFGRVSIPQEAFLKALKK